MPLAADRVDVAGHMAQSRLAVLGSPQPPQGSLSPPGGTWLSQNSGAPQWERGLMVSSLTGRVRAGEGGSSCSLTSCALSLEMSASGAEKNATQDQDGERFFASGKLQPVCL